MRTSDANRSAATDQSPPKNFRLKPETGAYGYKEWGKLKPCTLEDLKTVVSQNRMPPITMVWTPEFEWLHQPEKSSLLREAVGDRKKQSYKINIFTGVSTIFMTFVQAYSADTTSKMLLWLGGLIVAGVVLVMSIISLRRAENPENPFDSNNHVQPLP